MLAAFVFVAVMAWVPASYAATPSASVPVTIAPSQAWTSTPFSVHVGDSISIRATGFVHFGSPPIESLDPAGLGGAACAAIKQRDRRTHPFPVPALQCWSLIGKIGAGPPFEVGRKKTFRAPSAGVLSLGVNDNRLADNTGAWSATIVVTPPISGGTGPAKSTDKGKVILAALGALVILAILIALVLLSRRGTRRRRRVGASTEPVADEPLIRQPVPDPRVNVPGDLLAEAIAPAAVASAVVPTPDGPLEQTVAPLEGEFVDVNIFEVEVSNGTDLRVGYNYFPEGTELHWQVRQGTAFAHGQFATSGGGSLYHFVMLPLGVHLEPDPGSVDVEFTWTLGGVPFRYSVRRDPGY